MNRIVQFSGGVGSWAAARRIIDTHGPEGVVLLFADTKMEDGDLYRFLDDAQKDLDVPLVKIADGRNPWQVFRDVRFLGNTRVDPCSRILKRELLRKWIDANCSPEDTEVIFGIDWTEEHRIERARPRWEPWKIRAPLCEDPPLGKPAVMEMLAARGLRRPRLYDFGFPHNNCGGFCVKAGQAHFALLLREFPDRYRWHEAQEESLRKELGDVAILRDRRGGKLKPLPLKTFRESIRRDDPIDDQEWGGCGCALDD